MFTAHHSSPVAKAIASVLADAGLSAEDSERYGIELALAYESGQWSIVMATLILELSAKGYNTEIVDALTAAIASALQSEIALQVESFVVSIPASLESLFPLWTEADDLELRFLLS